MTNDELKAKTVDPGLHALLDSGMVDVSLPGFAIAKGDKQIVGEPMETFEPNTFNYTSKLKRNYR